MTAVLLALAITITTALAWRIRTVVGILVSTAGFWAGFVYALGFSADRGLIRGSLVVGSVFGAIVPVLIVISVDRLRNQSPRRSTTRPPTVDSIVIRAP